jgi:hypothetical protein
MLESGASLRRHAATQQCTIRFIDAATSRCIGVASDCRLARNLLPDACDWRPERGRLADLLHDE